MTVTMSIKSTTKIIAPTLRAAVNLRSSSIPTDLAKTSTALLSAAPSGGKHTLPDLPYDYAALERKFFTNYFCFYYHCTTQIID